MAPMLIDLLRDGHTLAAIVERHTQTGEPARCAGHGDRSFLAALPRDGPGHRPSWASGLSALRGTLRLPAARRW
jgi:hypothetical protein